MPLNSFLPNKGVPEKPYVFQTYPAMRYHPHHGKVTVLNQAHEEHLAPAEQGWVDSPAKFPPSPVRELTNSQKLEVLDKLTCVLAMEKEADEDSLQTIARILGERDEYARRIAQLTGEPQAKKKGKV